MTHDLYKHIPARLWSYVEADYEFCQGELEHVAELRDHDGFKELAKSIYSMDYDNKEAAQNILRVSLPRLTPVIVGVQSRSARGDLTNLMRTLLYAFVFLITDAY